MREIEYTRWKCTKCQSNPCFCFMERYHTPTACVKPTETDNSAAWIAVGIELIQSE